MNPTALPLGEERVVAAAVEGVAGAGDAATAAGGGGGVGGGAPTGDAGGGDGGDAGQAEGGGADGGGGRGVPGDGHAGDLEKFVYFDEQKCRNLVAQGRWTLLDVYLDQFLRSNGDSSERHPVLVLPASGELVLSTLRHTGYDTAMGFFKSLIRPLRQDAGLFVPLSGYVRMKVDSIQKKLENRDWSTGWPGNVEDFVERILDYIRLYFPCCIRHDQVSGSSKQALWNLTLILRNDEGLPIKSQNKTHYRCLACGWDGGSKSGIKAQESHLIGDKGHSSCEMTTPRIYQLFQVPLPEPCAEPRKMPRAGQKRKRYTRKRQIQGHPGQASSTNADLLPLDAVANLPEVVPEVEKADLLPLDAVANLPEVVPEVEQEDLYLDSIDFESLNQLLGKPLATMDVVAVLNSRRSMGIIVDALVRCLPELEFVRPARESLQAILECCNDSIILGNTRVVYASPVFQALGTMREAISRFEVQLLASGQETLDLFTRINWEVDALEERCLQAMGPPPPASHGQGHGIPAPDPPLSGAGHSQHPASSHKTS